MKKERKKSVMKDGRRSMVIYREWIVNGLECEIANPIQLVEFAAMAIGTLGLSDKKLLVLSSKMLMGKKVKPRQATLELLNPEELPDRLAENVCFVVKL